MIQQHAGINSCHDHIAAARFQIPGLRQIDERIMPLQMVKRVIRRYGRNTNQIIRFRPGNIRMPAQRINNRKRSPLQVSHSLAAGIAAQPGICQFITAKPGTTGTLDQAKIRYHRATAG